MAGNSWLSAHENGTLKCSVWFCVHETGSFTVRITDWTISLRKFNSRSFSVLLLFVWLDTIMKIPASANKRFISRCHCIGARSVEESRESPMIYMNVLLTPLSI